MCPPPPPPTIKVYLAAVRNLHLEAGFPESFVNLTLLPRLVHGIKRAYSRDRCSRLSITPQILVTFRMHLKIQWQDHSVLWSAMVISFFAFLRLSELLALQRSDVTIIDSTHELPIFSLRIRSSKTDPFRHSITVRITPSGMGTHTCIQQKH